MAEDSTKNLDQVLKKLKDSEFISIFFLLLGKKSKTNEDYISPAYYLEITKKDRNVKESFLKNILQTQSRDLLIEILWTIKRFDLLKFFKVCRHGFAPQSSLDIIWKSLYEVCESFDIEKDWECLKIAFPGASIPDEDHLEIFIIKAYNANLVPRKRLEAVLTDLNKHNQKSKTWTLHSEYYFIRSPSAASPCGLAIIINHENFYCEQNDGPKLERRKESLLDVVALEKLWKSFGFKTETYIDFKAEEVYGLFEKLSKKDLSSYDVFVTCYLSHGNEGVVYSSDQKPIQIKCLIDFMANKCKSLVNKPKLFFIQACQGTQIQCAISTGMKAIDLGMSSPILPVASNTNSSYIEYPSNTPLFVDFLLAVSSIPGFISFASTGKNSWFIEALVENLEQYGHQQSISDVLYKVNESVSNKKGTLNIPGQPIATNCKQTVEQRNTFRKRLQLKKLYS